jgi:hypothetical protein
LRWRLRFEGCPFSSCILFAIYTHTPNWAWEGVPAFRAAEVGRALPVVTCSFPCVPRSSGVRKDAQRNVAKTAGGDMMEGDLRWNPKFCQWAGREIPDLYEQFMTHVARPFF